MRWLGVLRSSAFWILLVAATVSVWSKQEPSAPGQPEGRTYVGTEACAACHEDLPVGLQRSVHALLEKGTRWNSEGQACEACHGPGSEHVEGGGDPEKIFSFPRATREAQNEACSKCHGLTQAQLGRRSSLHGLSELPCTNCHSVHAAKSFSSLKQSPTATCLKCHDQAKADFRRPFHHKVLEGGMTCADCHQPHGGQDPRQHLRAGGTTNACFRCHTDKQGPFAFEHAPLRLGDCTSCHVPHGSINPKMLVRARVQSLCLECHSASTPGIPGAQPPAFHDIRSPRFQNCTTCHVKIHGSNVSPIFFQ